MDNLFIGIDTSCYTTSICVADCNDRVLYDNRIVLTVGKGKRGLRQSEAHFQHVSNLPILVRDMKENIDLDRVKVVSYTDAPRFLEGSYMPVFTAGESFGRTLSSLLDTDLYGFSHQEGHIRSGLYNQEDLIDMNEAFLCVHISGGTSEILLVEPVGDRYKTEIVGGTLDISMGKLIDRIGVAMGLDFPCGKSMDDISVCENISKNDRLPVSIKNGYFNLSGIETKVLREMEGKDYNKAKVSIKILDAVTRTLGKSLNSVIKDSNISKVLVVGGVASNTYLRDNLSSEIESKCTLIFSGRQYATDNACGIALLGANHYKLRGD